jgi:aspartate/glutamate racemase
MAIRIGLVHAVRVSIAPTDDAFARLWPDAELQHLLDDGLAPDLRRAGAITPAIKRRFVQLAGYLAECGADGILFTCSAFGTAIELARQTLAIPVLKPNEAMIEEAVARASRIGLIATDPPAITSMVPEIEQLARERGKRVEVHAVCAEGAMAALRAGRAEAHDDAIAGAQAELSEACEVLVLAQFSMARARPKVEAARSRPVLTSPDSAVRKLKSALVP